MLQKKIGRASAGKLLSYITTPCMHEGGAGPTASREGGSRKEKKKTKGKRSSSSQGPEGKRAKLSFFGGLQKMKKEMTSCPREKKTEGKEKRGT